MPVQRDHQNNLFDKDGKLIGKVDYSGRVYDGIHRRGNVTSNDQYIDEYGHDQGWVRFGEGGGGTSSGGGLEGGIAIGFLGLLAGAIMLVVDWVNENPKRKRIAKRILRIWLILTLMAITLPFLGQGISDLIDLIIKIPYFLFTGIESIINFFRSL